MAICVRIARNATGNFSTSFSLRVNTIRHIPHLYNLGSTESFHSMTANCRRYMCQVPSIEDHLLSGTMYSKL